jgi:AmiR/NasT family two-component response regulator
MTGQQSQRLPVLLVSIRHCSGWGAFLLNAQPDLEVIGEAGSGLEAVSLAESLVPDVIVWI